MRRGLKARAFVFVTDEVSRMIIRPYAPSDLAQTIALHARVEPYRPGDETAVAAMHTRAARARHAGDRWVAPQPGIDRIDDIAGSYAAFWVAVTNDVGRDEVVGTVGVRRGVDLRQLGDPALHGRWADRDDVAELRRLRVAPEHWGHGIGRQLTETVIGWGRENGLRALALNTTTPQTPARALYEGLGFREVGLSFIGRYELVWNELALAAES